MDKREAKLDRLFRAAATGKDETVAVPFGFETRVVAQWRSGEDASNSWELARLVRRVAFAAVALLVIASAGAFWQSKENEALGDSWNNEYAIADSAIDNGALQ